MNIIGQPKISLYLNQLLKNNNYGTAFLFSGIKNLGKYQAASDFVSVLLCEREKDISCEICAPCVQFKRGVHPNYFEINILENKQEITIDQVKSLRVKLQHSGLGKNNLKAVIINSADCLNVSAGNALLKQLEEPRGATIFILLNNKQRQMLPTIMSRCDLVRFNPVSINSLNKELFSDSLSSEDLKQRIEVSGGLPIIAKKYITSSDAWQARINHLENLLTAIIHQKIPIELFDTSSVSWSEEQSGAIKLLEDFKFVWHNILLFKLDQGSYLQKANNLEQLRSFVDRVSILCIYGKLREINKTIEGLRHNIPSSLLLTSVF